MTSPWVKRMLREQSSANRACIAPKDETLGNRIRADRGAVGVLPARACKVANTTRQCPLQHTWRETLDASGVERYVAFIPTFASERDHNG